MIALLRGVLLEKHPNQAIVEAGGVGYDVTIPVSTFTRLPDSGAEVRLRIHTHVREDALSLYGFLTQDEKAMFEKLIGVSGIGPKLAVTILSGLAAPDLIHSIRAGDVAKLVRIVNRQPAYQLVDLMSCGPAPGPGWEPHLITLVFKASRHGRASARVSQETPIGICDSLQLRVGSREPYALEGGWNVLRAARGLIRRAHPR